MQKMMDAQTFAYANHHGKTKLHRLWVWAKKKYNGCTWTSLKWPWHGRNNVHRKRRGTRITLKIQHDAETFVWINRHWKTWACRRYIGCRRNYTVGTWSSLRWPWDVIDLDADSPCSLAACTSSICRAAGCWRGMASPLPGRGWRLASLCYHSDTVTRASDDVVAEPAAGSRLVLLCCRRTTDF